MNSIYGPKLISFKIPIATMSAEAAPVTVEAVQLLFVIILVGIPGMGKTVIGQALVRMLTSMGFKAVYLDQDMIKREEQHQDPAAEYLRRIQFYIANGYIVICGKGHHTPLLRKQVVDVLGKTLYCFVDLIPDDFVSKFALIREILLNRIRERKCKISTLTIEHAPNALDKIFCPSKVTRPSSNSFDTNTKRIVQLPFEKEKHVHILTAERIVNEKAATIVAKLRDWGFIPALPVSAPASAAASDE